ncbi:MAG TPA: DUF3710 domain-containing protein [Mycobacteriales bacterium]|nr:DUF3710 domain-containing protein [Mycobacteriales bacterium]
MFRRRRGGDDDPEEVFDDTEATAEAAGDGGAGDVLPKPKERPTGPWDIDDLPADGANRLDLGGLQVPVPEGVELRVDLDENQTIVAATFVHGEDVMQVGAFAAPRSEGIWDEVREDIAGALREQGGTSGDVEGPLGTELHARIPTDQPGVFAPARFIGVDGPRWFLRALVTGPATAQGTVDPVLADVFRGIAVVRGPDAMAPRDPIPLRLPKDAADQLADGAGEGIPFDAEAPEEPDTEPERPTLTMPERGPEITETR